MTKISKLISVAASAEVGKAYPILLNQKEIGQAIFLGKNEKEEFEFETGYDTSKQYEYMFDLDIESNELISIRVKNKFIEKK